MNQVFTNLLSNAVKYTRPRKHAVIPAGQTRQNGERVVFVRDNGVASICNTRRRFLESFSAYTRPAISKELVSANCSKSTGF